MKPVEITWKSSLPEHELDGGTEYKVLFEDVPDYVKVQWMKYADGVCSDEEMSNIMLEMSAVVHEDGSLEYICFQYYFDEYKEFELTPEDEKRFCEEFIKFVKEHGKELPDAYNAAKGELIGEIDWYDLAYNKSEQTLEDAGMNADKKEFETIVDICKRAEDLGVAPKERITLIMDLKNTHLDVGLDFQGLLEADDANFIHDVVGIQRNINRETKKLDNCFLPRYARQKDTGLETTIKAAEAEAANYRNTSNKTREEGREL